MLSHMFLERAYPMAFRDILMTSLYIYRATLKIKKGHSLLSKTDVCAEANGEREIFSCASLTAGAPLKPFSNCGVMDEGCKQTFDLYPP